MALNLDGLANLTKNYGQHQDGIVPVGNNKDAVQNLRLDEVNPDPTQPRVKFDEDALKSLSDSIVENGLLQPIVVRKADTGYLIVAGERRYRASQLAGLETIRAIVTEESDETKIAYLQLIENLQRADLDVSEVAEFIAKRLVNESTRTLAKKLGISQSNISKYAQWREYPDELKTAVKNGKVAGIRIAYELFQAYKKSPEKVLIMLETSDQVTIADVRSVLQERDQVIHGESLEGSAAEESAPKVETTSAVLLEEETAPDTDEPESVEVIHGESPAQESTETHKVPVSQPQSLKTSDDEEAVETQVAPVNKSLRVEVVIHGESGWVLMKPSTDSGVWVEMSDGSTQIVAPQDIQLVAVR